MLAGAGFDEDFLSFFLHRRAHVATVPVIFLKVQ